MDVETQERTNGNQGIVRQLGDLPADAVISEEGLAKILGKCRTSIKRAIRRGELPVPVRLFGESVWTVNALRGHLNQRLEEAKQAAEANAQRLQRRISQLSA